MKLTKFLPIPLIVGVLAFLWMVVSAQYNLLAWVAFITWGAYFLAGINTRSAVREAVSFTLGIIFGWVIVVVGTALTPSLGTYAFPVTVGLAGFTIVLLELVPWFDMAPGYFLGAAAFFAAGAKPEVGTFMSVWVPGMLGLALGVLTGYLRGMVFSAGGSKDPLQK
ncbi:DUF1097 domain-containing protein [Candidatus Daviesbacteria bacterium]|nr:DUF1097 domain-containing protein [Candidatus Daviesbacteria bacterium]